MDYLAAGTWTVSIINACIHVVSLKVFLPQEKKKEEDHSFLL